MSTYNHFQTFLFFGLNSLQCACFSTECPEADQRAEKRMLLIRSKTLQNPPFWTNCNCSYICQIKHTFWQLICTAKQARIRDQFFIYLVIVLYWYATCTYVLWIVPLSIFWKCTRPTMIFCLKHEETSIARGFSACNIFGLSRSSSGADG